MKKFVNYFHLKFIVFLLLGSFVLQADKCKDDQVCNNPTITVSTLRTQLWTEFTIKGSGFKSNADINASVHNQPPGLPVNQDLGSPTKANNNGEFTIIWHPAGGYLQKPVNTDVQPYFTATDGNCFGASNTVLSAYWY